MLMRSLTMAIISILLLSPPSVATPVLKLIPTQNRNTIGNPIYQLRAYDNGKFQFKIDSVTGTRRSQQRDRNIPDRAAPLPRGTYRIGTILASKNPRIGKTFIPLYPLFHTNRTYLGIHYQPHETAGCVGIINLKDRNKLNSFVAKYPRLNLIVKG
jgi:hypothetical protein